MKLKILLIINLILFSACSKHKLKKNLDIQNKIVENVKKTFSDSTLEKISEDTFYTNKDTSKSSSKVSIPYEKVPNFETNNFQSLTTPKKKNFKKNILVNGKSVKVNVESIPLNEFIKFIFSSVLKVNYTIDKNIEKMKQPITLNMSQPLPKQEVFNVVEKILKDEAISLVKKDDVIFIKKIKKRVAQNDLSDKYIVFGRKLSSNIEDGKKIMMFVPYYYMQPRNSYRILDNLGVSNVKFRYLNNNIQILYGEAENVRQTLEIINIIDTPSMAKKEPYLLKLENINVQKFKKRIETILKNNSIPLANTIKDIGIILNPIDELNSLLVLSPKKSWLEMILYWKEKLDIISDVSEKPQLYMYKVKFRKADEFAKILNDTLLSNNTSITTKDRNTSNSLQLSNNYLSHNQIKSDLYTNSLMMNLTSTQYKRILPIIKRLDVLPLQVLIEVTVAEVDITDNFNLGFEWTLLNNKALEGKSITHISGSHTLTLGGSKGLTSSLFKKNLTSIINAFAENKLLDILSRPSLMILNNKTGTINVGQQVPIISSEVSSSEVNNGNGTPAILRNVSYTNTGITVNLTPTINSNGTLTLNISVVLSEAQSNRTSNIDSPLIINRNISTSIVMHSDDSVLLGGLISHNFSNGNTGVPILKDIPIFGDLFKSQSKTHRKTELIVLIHPKIIDNNIELLKVTNRFKILMKSLKNL